MSSSLTRYQKTMYTFIAICNYPHLDEINDFLKQVEDKVVERGGIPSEQLKLTQVRNKILEKVKSRKMEREKSRERRNSVSSVRSTSSKRSSGDMAGGEHKSRRTTNAESSLPLPIKI